MVITEKKDRVGYVILNHPEKRNALGPEMVSKLKAAIGGFLQDDNIKIIVIKSATTVFCAGADLAYLSKIRNASYEENKDDSQSLRVLFDLIYNGNKIFISEVTGAAIAGGCGLATICDFCFAAPEASFGYTEAKIGFIPALVMVYLQNRISGIHLREMFLTGNVIDAEAALEIGLVNKLILAGDMDAEVLQFATELCQSVSSDSIALIKSMLRQMPGKSMAERLDYAVEMNAKARMTPDCMRGIDAFLNKEKISW